MKRRLLIVAALALALSLQLTKTATARVTQWSECFNENYGGGDCGMTCVKYNDEGSVIAWMTALFAC